MLTVLFDNMDKCLVEESFNFKHMKTAKKTKQLENSSGFNRVTIR